MNFNARSRIRISPRIFKNPAFHIQAQWNGFCIQIKVLVVISSYVSKAKGLHCIAVGCFNGISLAMVLARNAFHRLYAAVPDGNNDLLRAGRVFTLQAFEA